MDGHSITERVWLETTGQPYPECLENGIGVSVLAVALWCGNREPLAYWCIRRSLWMDAVVWISGLCDRRFLPLPMLYYHRFALWTALYDPRPSVGSLDGVGDVRATDDGDERSGDAGDALGYQHLRAWTR